MDQPFPLNFRGKAGEGRGGKGAGDVRIGVFVEGFPLPGDCQMTLREVIQKIIEGLPGNNNRHAAVGIGRDVFEIRLRHTGDQYHGAVVPREPLRFGC